MTIFKKTTIFLLFISLFFNFCNTAKAIGPLKSDLTNKINTQVTGAVGTSYNTGSVNVSSIVANVIQTLLSLLGIIFIILMLYGGFTWMTAGGAEDQVDKSLSIIKNAIIGLIIVIAAYAITALVFGAFGSGSTGSSGTGYI